LLAERLKKEKQAADLAAADEAKLKAERDRKSAIEKRISDLGDVYFALNSSSLTKSSKSILDSLAVIINEMPLLKLRITSHTDARGASSYNQWLSERRGIAAKNYLTSKGIDEVKLAIESFGERQLRNECDDNIYCPEEKHKVNRRAEFIIIQY
jgi:outer membrane protein OmpA-like peptidoglycan-associated protein